jgi:uncharacterized membrane protein
VSGVVHVGRSMRPLGFQPSRNYGRPFRAIERRAPSARVHPIWAMPRVVPASTLDRDVSRALRRVAVASTLVALSTVSWAAGVARGQEQPSDSGQADPGESASAWHDVLAFLGWILLAVVVFGLLLSSPAAAAPPPRRVEARSEADARELTVLTFDHTEGAERAYADARGRANDAPWLREVVFVECHRHGRIVVRGTFAGHYLDVDDVADAIGHDTAVGAVAGAVVGLAFGPPGFAAGLVAGGVAGGLHESSKVPEERGALFDEIRRDIPEGSSGLVALVSAEDSAALVEALHERAVRLTHHRLSAAEGAALQAAVAQAPRAATPDV